MARRGRRRGSTHISFLFRGLVGYSFLILGSFVFIGLQTLWGNGGDFLLPFKVAIVAGYSMVLFHLSLEVADYLVAKRYISVLMVGIDGIVLFGSLIALLIPIRSFMISGFVVVLPENVMPFEVRIVATAAFAVLAVVLAIA